MFFFFTYLLYHKFFYLSRLFLFFFEIFSSPLTLASYLFHLMYSLYTLRSQKASRKNAQNSGYFFGRSAYLTSAEKCGILICCANSAWIAQERAAKFYHISAFMSISKIAQKREAKPLPLPRISRRFSRNQATVHRLMRYH